MKIKPISLLLAITAFVTTTYAQAHDPKEHMKDAEKPNCSAMKDMDHSKMDMDDPVMQAMMKKCMKDMPHDKDSSETNSKRTLDVIKSEDKHADHQH
ncbi:MAG: hypothetical protein WBA20_11220 [Ketobacter sp.]|nr:MAG: hypothetical protein D6160_00155 [Ketobacter sp.]